MALPTPLKTRDCPKLRDEDGYYGWAKRVKSYLSGFNGYLEELNHPANNDRQRHIMALLMQVVLHDRAFHRILIIHEKPYPPDHVVDTRAKDAWDALKELFEHEGVTRHSNIISKLNVAQGPAEGGEDYVSR